MGDAMFSRRLWLTNFFSTKLFDCFLMYIIYIKKEIIKPVFYYYFIIHKIQYVWVLLMEIPVRLSLSSSRNNISGDTGKQYKK